MRLYKKFLTSRFPRFGTNKTRELERLLHEISKRDPLSPKEILSEIRGEDFEYIKKSLLNIRFPYCSARGISVRPYLPKLKIDPGLAIDAADSAFCPEKILVEKNSAKSALAANFKNAFPKAKLAEIESLKDYLKRSRKYTISDYNKRRKTIFITDEKHDFFKKCPCTKGASACGYHIFNLAFGCIFECAYCYLQEYVNIPGIVFPANIDDFFEKFKTYYRPGMRLGTGEFSDSLMLDEITGYSALIVDFFRNYKKALFEFKTKSANISGLLKARHEGNIVTSWSLNPQKIIDKNEFFTAGLKQRLLSAEKCAAAGYKTGFHFDPIFYFNGWESEYNKVIEALFSKIKPKQIAWISLGTFRFKPELKTIIENRFPDNEILDEELFLGYDNKLRYPGEIRYAIYRHMLKELKKHSKKIPIYLCMEEIKAIPLLPSRAS